MVHLKCHGAQLTDWKSEPDVAGLKVGRGVWVEAQLLKE